EDRHPDDGRIAAANAHDQLRAFAPLLRAHDELIEGGPVFVDNEVGGEMRVATALVQRKAGNARGTGVDTQQLAGSTQPAQTVAHLRGNELPAGCGITSTVLNSRRGRLISTVFVNRGH